MPAFLQSTFPNPKVKDLTEANAALRRLLVNDVPSTIKAIPLERLKLLTFFNSSLANAGGGSSQLGKLICAADKNILEGKPADVSILVYKSNKDRRVGGSTPS